MEHSVLRNRWKEYGAVRLILVAALALAMAGCNSGGQTMDPVRVRQFATRYTAAWCSQNAASVAQFFAENGSLKINDGPPAVGRAAITQAAQGFMTAFPDLAITMDGISIDGDHAVYRWTLNGRNTGPGGTGNAVRISGYEEWTFDRNGLVATSLGHFDAADYRRQLEAGTAGS